MARHAAWKVESSEDAVKVVFEGEVNESFDPHDLLGQLQEARPKVIRLDCAAVRRLNSEGIRRWVTFVREALKTKADIEYINCSVPMVSQFSMIPAMTDQTKVVSVFAPYVCEETEDEEDKLLEVASIDPSNPPSFPHADGGEWTLDEDPERFFAFLQPAVE